MRNDALKGHLEMLLLAALQNGPAHGYGVINDLKLRSEGVLDLQEGTIYPALHRLERAGLLTSGWDETSGRRRRVYALTDRGSGAVREKRRDWQAFALAVQGVLGAKAEPWPNPA